MLVEVDFRRRLGQLCRSPGGVDVVLQRRCTLPSVERVVVVLLPRETSLRGRSIQNDSSNVLQQRVDPRQGVRPHALHVLDVVAFGVVGVVPGHTIIAGTLGKNATQMPAMIALLTTV